mmetsp:Transcript_13929/g.20384  ORF Transcript_13929/g.20384 Transcript_13929/m.20384 type:complete len:105 (-) Transcript_13929:150-464(-)
MEESKNTTIDDLTKGLINYKFLGLDFEKAEGNRLKFTFTQLDAAAPDNGFSFVFDTNDEDLYVIHDCQPKLDMEVVEAMLEKLNEDDDVGTFVRGMRRAFSETL